MQKLERVVKKAVTSMIDIEIYGWPPVCIGMIYQPERPQGKPEMRKRLEGRKEILVKET